MTPAGTAHGVAGMEIAFRIADRARTAGLGRVLGADTGFLFAREPDLVRAPDVVFVAAARFEAIDSRQYFPGAPDLAVEVISPTDSFSDVESKTRMWLAHGARLVWGVDPMERTACVYRPAGPREAVPPDGVLGGEEILPGLAIPLAECLLPA